MTAPAGVATTAADRRRLLRARVSARARRRQVSSRLFTFGVGLALVIALVPIFSIAENVVSHGAHLMTWRFFSTNPAFPSLVHPDEVGGILNALIGTLVVVGLALVISLPVGILVSIGLYEFRNPVVRFLRVGLAVLIGLPSILFGLFIVVLMSQFHLTPSGLNGALALCLIIVPVIAIYCEEALEAVPRPLVEAGVALGARRSRLMRHVVIPTARPRMLTGIFFALARAAGETAPVLFVVGVSELPRLNPTAQTTTLPTLIWQLLQGEFPSQRLECWGIALVLMAGVLSINAIGRLFLDRTPGSAGLG